MASSALRAARIMRSLKLAETCKHTSRMMSTGILSTEDSSLYHVGLRNQVRDYTKRDSNMRPMVLFQSIRYGSSSETKDVPLKHVTQEVDGVITSQLEPFKEITKSEAVWTSLEKSLEGAAIKGALIPFSQLNFLQILFLPYTYLAMYYLDLMLNFLPWWQAIIATTATARLAFFPLVLKQNIIGIKSANILPETQKLQVKINEAMVSGDSYNQAILKTKIQLLYKEHGLSMKDRLMPILIQAPMYASIFFLLRMLTGVPVDGLSTGGALWFTDLTVPDPYYIMPFMTSASMLMLCEFGMEGSMNHGQQMSPVGRYFMRGMPFVLFFFIQSFPAATLLFWSTSNLFTLSYALIFKNQWVKKKLNIPARIVHDMADLPLATQTFKGQVKSAIDKGKVKRTSMDVRRLDDITFKKAGVGPLKKTYKEPPKNT